jgi:UDP-GlcNAc:undecaprenyl-phosphate/decaprenyl-phosphate GlcNAc-1-phosphate transferase
MKVLWLLIPAAVSMALAYLLTPLACRLALFVGAMDQPGARKVHKQPTARMGGLAVIAQKDKRGCDA